MKPISSLNRALSTVDVGTGGMFQVPSLKAARYHGPSMHDGCASSLS